MQNYNFVHSIAKTLIRVALIALPLIIASLPVSVSSLTIGGVLMLGFDALKAKYSFASSF